MNVNFKTTFSKGLLASFGGQFSTLILQFASLILLARFTPKDIFGVFSLILAITAFIQLLAGLGLDISLIRSLSSKSERDKDSLFSILVLRIISLFVVSILVIILSDFFLAAISQGLQNLKYYIILIFSLSSLRDFSLSYLQGTKSFKLLAYTQVISSIVKLVFYVLVYFVYKSFSLEILLYIEILYLFLSLIIQILVQPHLFLKRRRASFKLIGQLLNFAMPIYLNDILAVINGRVNTFIIAFYTNPASIASYEVASRIPSAFSRLFQAFLRVYYPNISSLYFEGKMKEAQKLIFNSLYTFTILLTLIVIIIFIFKDDIVILLFSAKYQEIAIPVFILILSFLIRAQGSIIGYTLVAYGSPKTATIVNFPAIAVGLIFSLIFVPLWGFIGAIYGVLLNAVIRNVLSYYYISKMGVVVNYLKIYSVMIIGSFFCIIFSLSSIETLTIKFIFAILTLLFSYLIFKDLRLWLQNSLKFILGGKNKL